MLLFLAACPAGGSDGLLLPPALSGSGTADLSCAGSDWPFIDGEGSYLADTVTEAPGSTGVGFGNSSRAVNSVCGAGTASGSTDVYSLKSSSTSTMCEANEMCIVLEWAGRRVLSGEGADFVVFENPFNRTGTARFIEAVIVEVSKDGTSWCGWNPDYSGEKNSGLAQFSIDIYDPSKYDDLAGVQPVKFYQSTWTDTAADVFDVDLAGGDHFDLDKASFGDSGEGCNEALRGSIQTDGFVYIRLTTANSRSQESFPLPGDSSDKTADIDGVVARNVADR